MTMRATCLVLGALLMLLAGCGGSGGGGGDDGGGSGGPPGDPVPPGFPPDSIVENFDSNINEDGAESTADWNNAAVEAGVLRSIPISSRTVAVFGYTFATGQANSGLGEYHPDQDVLIGQDRATAEPMLDPSATLGRRTQWAFSSAEMGAAGTVTAIEWGPGNNATVGATYPNVRLRMGYQANNSMFLVGSCSANFDGAATLLYDGAYSVTATANVGNTVGEPSTPHVGGYPENPGCQTGGNWNKPLFDYTGFYPWPAPTTAFDWDPAYASGAVLVFDASVQMGGSTQTTRAWRARTFPCSGILIGGFPERILRTTYEADAANPADNFQAGVVNPAPTVADTRFTLTTLLSRGVSLFYEAAYGTSNDYGAAMFLPAVQQDAAVVTIEYQGAQVVQADRRTIDTSAAFTAWTSTVDDCDGFRYLRYRITLRADGTTLAPARVDRVVIPVTATP